MPVKYVPKKDIAVELWVANQKTFVHMVTEEEIANKCAQFRTMAVENEYIKWEIYVVRPVYRRGKLNGFDRKLSREHAAKWKKKFENKFKN